MIAHDRIAGATKVIDHFGTWPDFHDAEVISVHLRRDVLAVESGATVDLSIHAFQSTNKVDVRGFTVLKDHLLIQFRFQQVEDIVLEGFNEQNSLAHILIRVTKLDDSQDGFEVDFHNNYGMSASFRCSGIEVVSVVPCSPQGFV